MKIVHIITTIDRGGAENALLALIRKQIAMGQNVEVVPLKGNIELIKDMQSVGVKVDLSLLNNHFIQQCHKLKRMKNRYDIYHAHLPRAELLVFLSRLAPFVVTRHNAESFFPRAPQIFSKLLSRQVTKSAEAVIAISKAVKGFVVEAGEIEDPRKIQVVYYGYTPVIANHNYELKAVPRNRNLRFVTVSRLAKQKNVPFLIDFTTFFSQEVIPTSLTIYGDGPELRCLTGRILQTSASIQLRGKTSDVPRKLHSFDCFLLASNYEGFGLVLLEAMDAGLPVFAPQNSAIPEVLGEDHPGLYKTGDMQDLILRIERVRSDPEVLKLMGRIQYRQLKFFSPETYFIQHNSIYNSIRERRSSLNET